MIIKKKWVRASPKESLTPLQAFFTLQQDLTRLPFPEKHHWGGLINTTIYHQTAETGEHFNMSQSCVHLPAVISPCK